MEHCFKDQKFSAMHIPLAFFGLRILEGLLVSSQGVLSLSLWRVSVTEIPLYLLFSNVVISFLSRQEALHFRFLVLSNLLLDQLLLRLPLIERYKMQEMRTFQDERSKFEGMERKRGRGKERLKRRGKKEGKEEERLRE